LGRIRGNATRIGAGRWRRLDGMEHAIFSTHFVPYLLNVMYGRDDVLYLMLGL
jgi:hypothetical protein